MTAEGHLALVTSGQLAALAALTPVRTKKRTNGLPLRKKGAEILDMRAEFEERGWYDHELSAGKHAVKCPWADEHSGSSGPSETVIYEPENDGTLWGFKCQHSHCAERTIGDVWRLLRADQVTSGPPQSRDDLIRRHFLTDQDIAALQPAPDLIEGLLQFGEVNMLFAPKNRGKTFLALDLAYSIATRQGHFLGRKIRKYGTVVYLCAEGRGGLPKRRAAWRQTRRYRDAVLDLVFWKDDVDIRDEHQVEQLIEVVGQCFSNVVLVIIDTLSQHMPGSDEGTADMGAALHNCQRIRDNLQTTVLAVHHPSKGDERNERGGSGFRGGCADVLNVEGANGVFMLTTQNTRDRAYGTPIPYVLDVVTLAGFRDEDGNPLTSCVPLHCDDARVARETQKAQELDSRVLSELQQQPASARSIATQLKRRFTDVSESLKRLDAAKRIQHDPTSKRWQVAT